MRTICRTFMAGLALTCAFVGAAYAADKPPIPEKYLKDGLTVGMFCASGVISYCDPGSTEGKGILAEFAKIWGDEAGVKVDVIGSSWEALMPSAVSGRTDVIAGIGDFEGRHAQFTFVDLFWNQNAVLVQVGNPLKVGKGSDLCGHKMSAATGSGELATVQSISAQCVKDGKAAIEVVEFGEQAATFLAVQTNRADATVTDIFASDELIRNNPGVYDEAYREKTDWLWGVAVPAQNKELLAMVSYGVEQAIANGKFKAVLDKNGFGDILADQLMINGKPVKQ